MEKIFVDGFGGIAEINGVVRIEMQEIARNLDGSDGIAVETKGELLMPLSAFLSAAADFQNAASSLLAEIEESVEGDKKSTNGANADTNSGVVIEEQ